VIALASGTHRAHLRLPRLVWNNRRFHNWANYQSHLMAYAAKGLYGRKLPIMTTCGALRPAKSNPTSLAKWKDAPVLDSVRALKRLPEARIASGL